MKEKQFLMLTQQAYNSKFNKSIVIDSFTFIRDLHEDRKELAVLFGDVVQKAGFEVDPVIIDKVINHGKYLVSDLHKECLLKLQVKKEFKLLQVMNILVYVFAALAVYFLFQVHVVLSAVCTSIGSSLLFLKWGFMRRKG